MEHGEEIVIARAGRPVAKLVRLEPPKSRGFVGRNKGKISMSEDFDEALPWHIFPGFPPKR